MYLREYGNDGENIYKIKTKRTSTGWMNVRDEQRNKQMKERKTERAGKGTNKESNQPTNQPTSHQRNGQTK